jgi:ATP-dependent RNA helicase DeaD
MQQSRTKKQQKFKKRLENTLKRQDLQQQQEFLIQLQQEMEVPLERCAAALMYLAQPNLFQVPNRQNDSPAKQQAIEIPAISPALPKAVRYRLEVGQKHGVTREEIEQLLVQESGVDIKRITRVDIKQHYTLVELPDGMPADIFQLLSEAKIRQQKLRIKRLKPQRRYRRYRRQV